MRSIFVFLFSINVFLTKAQTLGGSATYNFLKLPASPVLSAMGGVNTSYNSEEVSLAGNNPALFSKELHSQVGLSFNNFFAGVKAYNLSGAYHHNKLNTSFGGSVLFIDYGKLPQADANGNTSGDFRPNDYVLQVAASRKYLEKWQYGLQAKFIHSDYGLYRSSGLAVDFGLLFSDTSRLLSFGIIARNMGLQLEAYDGFREDLPFDIQIGVTKRLLNAPIGFSLTAHQIHRWNQVYDDTLFNRENNFSTGTTTLHKLFNHLVLAIHIYLDQHLQFAIGYNRLRREELNLGGSGNGINGFSGGLIARFRKIHIQYGRAYFQRSYAYNQFGINFFLCDFAGNKKL